MRIFVPSQRRARPGVARRVLLAAAAVFMLSQLAVAQTPQYYIGGGTGGNYIPWGAGSTSSWQKWQGFYGPGVLTGAYPGNISKVWFRRYYAQGGVYTNLRISIGQIAGTTYPTGTFYSPMTQAFFASSYTLPSGNVGDWFGVSLTNPVYYNPALSLVVEVCMDANPTQGPPVYTGSTTTGQNLARLFGGPGCTATSASSDGTRNDFGIDENPALPNDAGITAILSPVNFCAGTYSVDVNMKNFGTNSLSSVTINWTYDGVPQIPIPWSGSLSSLSDATINLGTMPFASGIAHVLRAWTSTPNGQTDSFTANDTLQVTLKPALSGTFTIGGASPDYPSFTAAFADLNANGICGPCTFNVRTGTYTEQVSLNAISGTSPVNTITFQSETGVNTDVTLTYANQTSTQMHTLMLNGADWTRFRNMTITGTNTAYARILTLQSGSTNNIFEGNRIIAPPVNTTSSNNATVYSYYSGDNNNEFNNNTIQNGGYGVYYFGSGTGAGQMITGLEFHNNRILDFYYMGCYLYYMDAIEFTDNLVQTSASYSNYMVYGYYWYNKIDVQRNKLIQNMNASYVRYGMMLYYAQAAAGQEGTIANNFVSLTGSSTIYCMYLYYPYNQNVEFNTLNNRCMSTSGYTQYLYYGQNVRYMNNILYNSNTGYVTYFYNTTWRGFDYNVFYTPYTTFGYWNGTSYATWPAWQAVTGLNANSISKPITFKDVSIGDLHLAGTSQNDLQLTGINEPYITNDIDNDPRILPYRGADEACYILPNTVTTRFVDDNGQTVTYGQSGSTLKLELGISFPNDAINATITVNFYTVPSNTLAYSYTFSAVKLLGQSLLATYLVPVPGNLGSGYYRVESVVNTKNSCGDYIDYRPGDKSMLIVAPGQTPCLVWPGDVNNDGLVNYGDRTSLNRYIFDANLRPTWLQGPARYRPDFATNPLTYYTWEAQASAPWTTPEGCYMDADGNGVVNTYDMIVIKVNFMKTHGFSTPKSGDALAAGSFDMSQNYPNPFNPSTSIQYSVPERSTVRLVVTDLLGREVSVLMNGTVEAGVHTLTFDGAQLESGVYTATVSMTGLESGLAFSKSVRMTLAK